jgi:hypothetical protein
VTIPEPDKVKTKRAGRKRRAAGWTLLTFALLVAAAWAASRWFSPAFRGDRFSVSIFAGQFNVMVLPQSLPDRDRGWMGYTPSASERHWTWWYGWRQEDVRRNYGAVAVAELQAGRSTMLFVNVLLWPIPLLLTAPAVFLLRSAARARRHAKANSCTKCGYSLTGLTPNTPCPECGRQK